MNKMNDNYKKSTSDKKIIYLDLDDTLLTSDKVISPGNAKALEEVLDAGHYVAITTGRPIEGGKIITKNLGLNREGCYMLSFHGSVLYDCYRDEILMSNGMDSEDVIALLKELDAHGIYAQTFNEKVILSMRESEELIRYNAVTNEPYEIIHNYDELHGQILPKVIAIDFENHEKLAAFQREFAPREAGHYNSFFSCMEYLEYCKEGSNKGSGLRYLANYLSVPIENTVAVGDERNDIPMIEAAGVGVAMCNGRIEAKNVADYVTEHDNDHDGVAEAIYKFILS